LVVYKGGKGMHVLLVEDDPHDIFFFRKALERITLPIVLSVVEDGEDALAFLFNEKPYTGVEKPDILLLDLNMPKKNGFEVLAARAQDLRLKCIPVIMLTTSDHPRDIDRCYELGANAYLTKPAGLENLRAVVKNLAASCEASTLRRYRNEASFGASDPLPVKTTIELWSGCKFRTRALGKPEAVREPLG